MISSGQLRTPINVHGVNGVTSNAEIYEALTANDVRSDQRTPGNFLQGAR